jgi:hypothetical protein
MAPNDSMSCWEKAHSFYIPKGLFKAGMSKLNQEWTSSNKLKFVNAAMSKENVYLANALELHKMEPLKGATAAPFRTVQRKGYQ